MVAFKIDSVVGWVATCAVVVALTGCDGAGDEVGGAICGNDSCETAETDLSCPADCASGSSQAEKPASLPTFEDVQLYSANSPLNQKIPSDAKIDPNSANYVDVVVQAGATDGFVIEFKQFSAPVYFADSSTPRTVCFSCVRSRLRGCGFSQRRPDPEFCRTCRRC